MSDRPHDADENTVESDGDGDDEEFDEVEVRNDGVGDVEVSNDEISDGDVEDEESEWRFDVDEVGPDGVEREERSIEPEGIHLEHALFVVLGILMGVGAILATIL